LKVKDFKHKRRGVAPQAVGRSPKDPLCAAAPFGLIGAYFGGRRPWRQGWRRLSSGPCITAAAAARDRQCAGRARPPHCHHPHLRPSKTRRGARHSCSRIDEPFPLIGTSLTRNDAEEAGRRTMGSLTVHGIGRLGSGVDSCFIGAPREGMQGNRFCSLLKFLHLHTPSALNKVNVNRRERPGRKFLEEQYAAF
jgi:hypothetical protein